MCLISKIHDFGNTMNISHGQFVDYIQDRFYALFWFKYERMFHGLSYQLSKFFNGFLRQKYPFFKKGISALLNNPCYQGSLISTNFSPEANNTNTCGKAVDKIFLR